MHIHLPNSACGLAKRRALVHPLEFIWDIAASRTGELARQKRQAPFRKQYDQFDSELWVSALVSLFRPFLRFLGALFPALISSISACQ